MCKTFRIVSIMGGAILCLFGSINAQLVEKWSLEHKLDLSPLIGNMHEGLVFRTLEGDLDGDGTSSTVSYTADAANIRVKVRNRSTGEIEYDMTLPNEHGPSIVGAFLLDVDADGRDELVFHYKMHSVVYEYGDVSGDIESSQPVLPEEFELAQNYPNPFNPKTTLSYSIPTGSHVTIEIFNVLGQKVRTLVNESKSAGVYQVIWDGDDSSGRSVSSGVYFYRVQAGDISETRKMLLLK